MRSGSSRQRRRRRGGGNGGLIVSSMCTWLIRDRSFVAWRIRDSFVADAMPRRRARVRVAPSSARHPKYRLELQFLADGAHFRSDGRPRGTDNTLRSRSLNFSETSSIRKERARKAPLRGRSSCSLSLWVRCLQCRGVLHCSPTRTVTLRGSRLSITSAPKASRPSTIVALSRSPPPVQKWLVMLCHRVGTGMSQI